MASLLDGGPFFNALYDQKRMDTHVSAYIYIERTTKPPAKIKQVPFENVPQV